MSMNGESAESQPHAEAAGFILAAQACEFFEDAILVCRRDAGAVIAHPELDEDPHRHCADFDLPPTGVNLLAFSSRLISTR